MPCLLHGEALIWDSLGITEYLAERHAGVWPADSRARAWARCASAEMHGGFPLLRQHCTMNLGLRVELARTPVALEREIARLDALWLEGLDRFGGPFLAGPAFTAVDAFYAPVAFRILTYSLAMSPRASRYASDLRALPAMREWYAEALQEQWRDPAHEDEARRAGAWTADLRVMPDATTRASA